MSLRFDVGLTLAVRCDSRADLDAWLDAITGHDFVLSADQTVATRAMITNDVETEAEVSRPQHPYPTVANTLPTYEEAMASIGRYIVPPPDAA